MQIVRTTHLTKYYGKARGVTDVNLSIEQGEFFGFIGPNGAGKSTTIRALLGLISPTSGSAALFGRDVARHRTSVLENVGYLPSETQFYPGMKVKDLLKLSAGLRKKDCSAEAERLCARLQLDPSRRLEELSLGNRKKAAIICALQHQPQLLVLDEPTGGLDPLMQKEFFDILLQQNRQGATVLLSSHVLSEVQRACTRAAIIRDGRIIACDNVESLCKTSAKRVAVHGRVDLTQLEGVRGKTQENGSVSFFYNGDMQRLVQCLSLGQVDDLTVTEPDLEEIFFHYYLHDSEEKAGERV